MSEMIERVAGIIAEGVAEDLSSEEIARRVFAAMRGPTEAMVESANSVNDSSPGGHWAAMIDEALK